MKRIAVLIFIFPCAFKAFSATAEISSEITFSIPVDESNCMIRNISTIKYNMGLRLNLGADTITGNCRFDSTKLMDLYGYTPMDYIHSQDYTYGIQHNQKLGKLNLDILAGTLRFSNAISRLKNPSITCPSPLKKGSVPAPGIAPSIPTSSSSRTPVSFAMVLTPVQNAALIPTLQIAILETEEKYGAIYKKLSTQLIPELLFSCSGGTFFHHYENENGWYHDKRHYMESDFLSGELSLSTSWRYFKNSVSIGIYENPFGGTRRWIRNQTYLTFGFFSLGLYVFDSDMDVITASGNLPRIGRQIFISPQFRFHTSKGTLSLGTTIGETSRKSKERMTRELHQYYMKAAASFDRKEVNLGWNLNLDYSTDKMKLNNSWGLNAGIPIRSARSDTSFNYAFSDEAIKNYKISQKIYFKKNLLESLAASWTWTDSKGNGKWNFDASANFMKRSKRIKAKGRISFSFRKLS
ncbi:hypothetical protein [Treponema sp.]|uniref:hypothetical protein n=1 Tax=Treponema sp. TaxID=166 RepID=UPI00388EFCA6